MYSPGRTLAHYLQWDETKVPVVWTPTMKVTNYLVVNSILRIEDTYDIFRSYVFLSAPYNGFPLIRFGKQAFWWYVHVREERNTWKAYDDLGSHSYPARRPPGKEEINEHARNPAASCALFTTVCRFGNQPHHDSRRVHRPIASILLGPWTLYYRYFIFGWQPLRPPSKSFCRRESFRLS